MSFVPTKFLKYQQNIERNSIFLMWKCQNFLSSLAPLARIYIDFLNVNVLSAHCRLYYSAIPYVMKGNCIDCIKLCMQIGDLKIYMFKRQKYLKYQQNIEGNGSFRISKCKKFLSSLAPLARIFIDFSQC